MIGLAEALRAPPPRHEIVEGVGMLAALAAMMTVIIVLLPEKPWEMVAPVSLLFPILWLAAIFAASDRTTIGLVRIRITDAGRRALVG